MRANQLARAGAKFDRGGESEAADSHRDLALDCSQMISK
jgi:hypothetical protein